MKEQISQRTKPAIPDIHIQVQVLTSAYNGIKLPLTKNRVTTKNTIATIPRNRLTFNTPPFLVAYSKIRDDAVQRTAVNNAINPPVYPILFNKNTDQFAHGPALGRKDTLKNNSLIFVFSYICRSKYVRLIIKKTSFTWSIYI